jgi:Domain of unknown function (DUF4349)
MRIIPFPARGDTGPEEAFGAELEAALDGDGVGAAAESWRELRTDVRALAPPMAPEFERRLAERIAERSASRRPRGVSPAVPSAARPRPASRRRDRWLGWLRRPARLGAAAAVAIAVVAAVAIVAGTHQPGSSKVPALSRPALATSQGAVAPHARHGAEAKADELGPAEPAPAEATSAETASAGAATAPGRVQQLAATITLAASSNDVQATADRVARLTVGDGGFVQNSHVQVQTTGTSEANLMLRLPSAKLDGALGSLGQLAPVRAESQSLQDITDAYDAAERRLSDADAERQALLRALSAAITQGQIDSLREQLAQAGGAIAQARSALHAVSQRASTAEVEVNIVGDGSGASEGLTLHHAVHDAGRVLVVTLAVLLIAAAILVPLALLLVALASGGSAWRRYRRERALDMP